MSIKSANSLNGYQDSLKHKHINACDNKYWLQQSTSQSERAYIKCNEILTQV